MKRSLARAFAAVTAFIAGTIAFAAEPHVSLVPWKVVDVGTTIDAPLVLFWVPASTDELRRSPLLTSEELTLFSSRCVAMRVIRLTDRARLARLEVEDEIPAIILTDRGGHVIGRVEGENGALSAGEVEALVREELDRREEDADARLDRARERSEADDIEAAAALYRSVWEERCVCPRQARDAKKALRKLGRK